MEKIKPCKKSGEMGAASFIDTVKGEGLTPEKLTFAC